MDSTLRRIEVKLKEANESKRYESPGFVDALQSLIQIFKGSKAKQIEEACLLMLRYDTLEGILTNSNVSDSSLKVTLEKEVIWNYTDECVNFCKACVVDRRVVTLLLDELSEYASNLGKLDNNNVRHVVKANFGIMLNLLRHCDSTKDIIRSKKGTSTIKSFTESCYLIVRMYAFVTMAFCGEVLALPEDDVEFLQHFLKTALTADDHIHAKHGMSVQEILMCITKLIAGNDQNKVSLSKAELVSVAIKIVDRSKYNDSEVLASLQLLSEFSLTDEILQQTSLRSDLENIAKETKVPDQLRQACSRLLNKLKKTPEKHVMLSYQWDSQPIVKELRDYLKSCGFRVWIDLEKMAGSMNKRMAEGVENATLMIIALTKKYGESENTQKEAEYADERKVPLLPIKLEKNFEPSGWLGLLTARKIYVSLTNGPPRKNFDKVVEQIEKLVPNIKECKLKN